MEKRNISNFLSLIIIGDKDSDFDGTVYVGNGNQHIDTLFDCYNHFDKKGYSITLFKPFKVLPSFIEMIVLNGHIVIIDLKDGSYIVYLPDKLTDKQIVSLNKYKYLLEKVFVKSNVIHNFDFSNNQTSYRKK